MQSSSRQRGPMTTRSQTTVLVRTAVGWTIEPAPGAGVGHPGLLLRGHRGAHGEVVGRGADVQEPRPAAECVDPARPVPRGADETVVQAADGRGRSAGGQAGEGRRLHDLHAHEVRRRASAGGREPADATVGSDQHPAVAGRIGMRGHPEGHCCPRAPVVFEQLAEAQVGERVAVDDEEARAEQRQRPPRPARRAEQDRLPGVTDADSGGGPVPDRARDRLRAVVQVEHDVGNPLPSQPVQDAEHQRPARHRNRGLRPDVGQRGQAPSESRREHEGGRQRVRHRGCGRRCAYSKTMSATGRPRRAQSAS